MNNSNDITELTAQLIELIESYSEKITLVPILGVLEATKMELLNQAREYILHDSHH